uniref:Uncharacterized protein n=1 Tax=uncultured marine group II/III euryarchaeote AD1000_28_D03 TaxID=1457747 RepID=A0A075FN53_9EURY|nr:hypothetical protein [uncultured marine group II/III euryarchaeote AD1000_28_D03]
MSTTSPKVTGTGSSGSRMKPPRLPSNPVPTPMAQSLGGIASQSTPARLSESMTAAFRSSMSVRTLDMARTWDSYDSSSIPSASPHFRASRCPNEPAPWTRTTDLPESLSSRTTPDTASILSVLTCRYRDLSVISPPPNFNTTLDILLDIATGCMT